MPEVVESYLPELRLREQAIKHPIAQVVGMQEPTGFTAEDPWRGFGSLARCSLNLAFCEEIPQGLMKWLTPRFSRQKAFTPDFSRTRESFPLKKPARDVGGFRIGQNVTHPKFGPGVIVDAEGQGGDARVQVNFGNQGLKWLAVSVAKLQAA